MIGAASTSKCAARAAAAVKAVRLIGGVIPEKPEVLMPSRYRFDFEHITKTNIRQDCTHSGSVAVTLYPGDPFARAAIVDASRVSRVPDVIRQVRVCPTVFWRR
jgi:hypothetical protein